MKQSKHTKRALLTSVLAMLLCMAMLVGSTFAWFTDSVTTGVNKIVAGNLDVELYVKDAAGTYVPVNESISLFDEHALWEPGYTQVVYLKVKNASTLALKYKFAVNVISETDGVNVDGNPIKLAKHLVFGQKAGDTETTYRTREEAWKAVGETKGLKDYSDEQVLLPKAEKFVTLVVYMPTTVGNEANYRGDAIPTIELGITLAATQTPYERDSFGENYDLAAWLEMVATDNKDGTYENEGKLYVKDSGSFVEVQKDETVTGLYTAVEGGEKYVTTFDAWDVAAPAGGNVTILNNIEKEYEGTYYPNYGITVASTTPFLELNGTDADINLGEKTVDITSDGGKNGIVVKGGAAATFSNGSVEMNMVYGSSYPIFRTDGNSEITLNNMTVNLTNGKDYCLSPGSGGGKIVIKNSTISNVNKNTGEIAYGTSKGAVYCGSSCFVVIENSKIVGNINSAVNGHIELRGGDYTEAALYGQNSSGIIVYSGTFSQDPRTYKNGCTIASGSTVVDNGNGTWTVTAG